jgi:ADP-heptose:LPS heptosyltransferase
MIEPTDSSGMIVDDQPTNVPNNAAEQRYIDEYTLTMRRHKERPGENIPLGLRMRRAIEGANRRAWYFAFSHLFNSEPVHRRIPIEKIESIFVIPIGDAIGDMVVALPLFHAIKRYNPSCRVGTLISPRNRGLLLYDSNVDRKYLFRDKDDVLHYPQLFRARNDGYQIVINMHLPRMTEFGIVSNIIGKQSIKVSSSHARKDMYRQLFNMLLPYDRNSMHLSQLGLMMLESVIDFGQPLQQWESHPTIQIDEEQRVIVRKSIQAELDRLGADWFVHFNPQARNPTREWGFDNAFEFAERFVEHYPRGALFFTASPVHRAEVEKRIAQLKLPRVMFFPTSYNLLELASLAAESELIITPDTSVIHFGTASGKPTLVLWPDPEFLPLEWIPLQVPSINLAPEIRGMLVPTISVESVWHAALQLLDKSWTSSATSYGLHPKADSLYQAANCDTPIADLVKASLIPKIFPEGSSISIPLSEIAETPAVQ